MLYLAEVQKKARVIGSGKTELKLLACQRSEQSWSAVAAEELIPAPDDANYNSGALVMVELTASRQIQRHGEAGRQLVSILQNFSRLQEKFKTQEEEIEQWKQSLTYQSQELNRREMEMEARQEQLQQMEEDFERLEQQRQEIETAREELDRFREEFERKNQDLEGAWAQLNGEMRRLEEQQQELQQSSVLDAEQAAQIQELLNRLSGAVAPTESVREQLNFSFEIVANQQEMLGHHWQNLEQQRASAQQLQEDVERQFQEIQNRWQEWFQSQDTLVQAQAELQVQQNTLGLRQEQVQALSSQIQSQESLHQQVFRLTEASDQVRIGAKIDLQALEEMSLEKLQSVIQDLHRDFEKSSRFVESQEEELRLEQDAIDEIKQRIQQASEYDRLSLETELADEQDRYKMLNETLVGQRRNLREREETLKQHQRVLDRRQGHATGETPESDIDLGPVLAQIDVLRQQQSQELSQLEAQIKMLRGSLEQSKTQVEQQTAEQESRRNELKQLEQHWQEQRTTAAELWGKVNLYQETLQPMQDNLDGLKQKLEAITGLMAQFQEASDYQLQAIAEMQQKILHLTGTPELAAS